MSDSKIVKISSVELKAKRARSKTKFGAKSAFILGQPADRPAAEVVAEGAKLGLKFLPIYVHTVRLRARKSASQPPKRRGRKPTTNASSAAAMHPAEAKATSEAVARRAAAPKAASPKASPRPLPPQRASTRRRTSVTDAEARFAELVLDLGFSRAEAILRSVREVMMDITLFETGATARKRS